MGIDDRSTIKKILDLDREELNLMVSVKTKFLEEVHENKNENISKIIKQLSESIQIKKQIYNKPIEENPVQEVLKNCVKNVFTLIGLVTSCASAYYAIGNLLIFLSPVLIGTPVGWAIIGLGLLTAMFFFLSMRGSGVVSMMNPEKAEFEKFKEEINRS